MNKCPLRNAAISLFVLLVATVFDASAEVVYVDGRATGGNNGSCWDDEPI